MIDPIIAILLPIDLWLFGTIIIIIFRKFIDLFKNGHEMGVYTHPMDYKREFGGKCNGDTIRVNPELDLRFEKKGD